MRQDDIATRVLIAVAQEVGTTVERLKSHPECQNLSELDSLDLVEVVSRLIDDFRDSDAQLDSE